MNPDFSFFYCYHMFSKLFWPSERKKKRSSDWGKLAKFVAKGPRICKNSKNRKLEEFDKIQIETNYWEIETYRKVGHSMFASIYQILVRS